MGSPLSTVPPWYSVEDDWTPPPSSVPQESMWFPPKSSDVPILRWFLMTGSLRDDHVAQRPSERERLRKKLLCVTATALQPTYSSPIADDECYLTQQHHNKTDQPVCVSQTEKIKLFVSQLFVSHWWWLLLRLLNISHKVTDNIPLQKIGRSLKLYDRLFLTTSKHFLQIFWYHNF